MRRTANQIKSSSPFLILESLAWLVVLIIAWWSILSVTEVNARSTIYFTSIVSILAGIRAFIGHGHATITATGLFALSTSMFIGYSGVILAGQDAALAKWQYVALASGAGLTAQILTTLLAWRRLNHETLDKRWFSSETANWAVCAGFSVLSLSAGLHIAFPGMQTWSGASAFTAICILAAGLLLRENSQMLSWRTLVIGATLVLYSEFFHAGTGRLLLVALACAIAVIYAARFQSRSFKLAIVILIPLALWWMAHDRLALEESLGQTVAAERTGLESMTASLNVFALLLEALHEQNFTPSSYGYNLLSVPALLIPESVWPNQPQALGYEVVRFYDPARYGDGIFSTVVSFAGEGIYNFGWLGLAIVIVVAAAALRVLDSILIGQLKENRTAVLGLMGIVLVAMLAGAIADYTWSGVHTYAARMLRRLPAFLIVLIFAWLRTRVSFSYESKEEVHTSSIEITPARGDRPS